MVTQEARIGVITEARITAMPKTLFDPMPVIMVRIDGGAEERLFDYYPDEISFSAAEFVGLTKSEALKLKHQKDLSYLRS